MTTLGPAPFSIQDPDDYRRIRAVFEEAGYTDRAIVDTLERSKLRAPGPKQLPRLLHRTDGGRPVDTLIRLFLLGVSVPEPAAVAALAPMSVDDWRGFGLLRRDGDGVSGCVQIRYYQGMLVAFDWASYDETMAEDFVMGISPSSLTLAGATVRRRADSVLDLGTGSGFQALLAAQHSERVVATDLNERAVAMADFNARLNGIDVDCRAGDLFAPVAGETFDLIVSNAPFVVAPDRTHYFLHGGVLLDGVCRAIAASASHHLNEGGICQFLANWVIRDPDEPDGGVARWFDGTGCDAWVMVTHRYDPEDYAATWIEVESDGYAAEYDRWVQFFAAHDVAGVGYGLVTMRSSGRQKPWVAIEDAPESYEFPCGDDVLSLLDARTWLSGVDDEALLETRLALDPGVRLDTQSVPSAGRWQTQRNLIRRTTGLKYEGPIDPAGAALVATLDGSQQAGVFVSRWMDDHEIDRGVLADVCGSLRLMVERGFLRIEPD